MHFVAFRSGGPPASRRIGPVKAGCLAMRIGQLAFILLCVFFGKYILTALHWLLDLFGVPQ